MAIDSLRKDSALGRQGTDGEGGGEGGEKYTIDYQVMTVSVYYGPPSHDSGEAGQKGGGGRKREGVVKGVWGDQEGQG